MVPTQTPAPQFNFTFYHFVGEDGNRTTQVVRDAAIADGMRGLVNYDPQTIQLATQRVNAWAASKGMTVTVREPYPSTKHPGKVWMEYRFGGISL
jgi:hypothetical protein